MPGGAFLEQQGRLGRNRPPRPRTRPSGKIGRNDDGNTGGFRSCPPWRVDVGDALKDGENAPSGLLGPVKIVWPADK